MPLWWIVIAPPVAAVVAGFVETAPIRVDDNLTVPATAAAVLWSLSFIDASAWRASLPALASRLAPALALNLIVAFAGWRARTVTVSGAVVGAAIGLAVFVGTGGRAG